MKGNNYLLHCLLSQSSNSGWVFELLSIPFCPFSQIVECMNFWEEALIKMEGSAGSLAASLALTDSLARSPQASRQPHSNSVEDSRSLRASRTTSQNRSRASSLAAPRRTAPLRTKPASCSSHLLSRRTSNYLAGSSRSTNLVQPRHSHTLTRIREGDEDTDEQREREKRKNSEGEEESSERGERKI